mmetsp:Transcript_51048/g.110775  ORF Transcript_51048/g.110775 Transcript_51048/m.110775 type:complete len:252 (-) Transcript_51048:146-901(-)
MTDGSLKSRTERNEAEISLALQSETVRTIIEVLTGTPRFLRGCQVNPDRAHLQAVQDVVRWTVGGYTTRPTEEDIEKKAIDRLELLVNYRQPPIESMAVPTVAMYDYLCDTIFGIPMCPVGPDVAMPTLIDTKGNPIQPRWHEADWKKYFESGMEKPTTALRPNRYPYQLPEVDGQRARHYILWYFHYVWEEQANPTDAEIESDITLALTMLASEENMQGIDYIWYRNPAISVPDMFHVQIFWRPAPLPRE